MTIQMLVAAVIASCVASDCGAGVSAAEDADPKTAPHTPFILAHLQKSEFWAPSPIRQNDVTIGRDLAARLAERKSRLQATRAVVRDGKVFLVK